MLLVPLKVYCRKRHGGWRNVQMDDYMSMVALAVANGFFYVCIIGTYLSSLDTNRRLTLSDCRHARVTGTTHQ